LGDLGFSGIKKPALGGLVIWGWLLGVRVAVLGFEYNIYF
jgi:hypothetical protein